MDETLAPVAPGADMTDMIQRNNGVSFIGQFGAFSPARLKIVQEVLGDGFAAQQIDALQGFRVFTSPAVNVTVSPMQILISSSAEPFSFDLVRSIFGRLSEAGLTPEEVTINIGAVFSRESEEYARSILGMLPFLPNDDTLIGGGFRVVIRDSPDTVLDFTVENEFTKAGSVLCAVKGGITHPTDFESGFQLVTECFERIRTQHAPVLLGLIAAE